MLSVVVTCVEYVQLSILYLYVGSGHIKIIYVSIDDGILRKYIVNNERRELV